MFLGQLEGFEVLVLFNVSYVYLVVGWFYWMLFILLLIFIGYWLFKSFLMVLM